MPSRPQLSFAVEQRILRETTLDDMPEGQSELGDGIVRVYRSGIGAGACSGALVDDRHVMTAAHCVVEHNAKAAHEMTLNQIAAGSIHVELGGDALPWGRVGVVNVRMCDGYTGDLQHDLAMLVLSRPVPKEVPTFSIGYDVPEEEAAVFELGGFGTNATPRVIPETSWGVISVYRHVIRGPVLSVADDFIVINVPGKPGDSGGPIVDTKTGRIVSIVSRGTTSEEVKKATAGKTTNPNPNPTNPNPNPNGRRSGASTGVVEDEKGMREREPLVAGPRFYTCKKAIDESLAR